MLAAFLRNHPLANLTFGLVLVAGFLAYGMLPRQQDPTINFNWIVITTILPGASAQDVEKKVTDPLEDAIRGIGNMKFVSSTSRESVSSLLVRFDGIAFSTVLTLLLVPLLYRLVMGRSRLLREAAGDA